MDFHYIYTINAPPERLWEVVTDVPKVGSCIPGATDIKETGDGTYTGTVKVRVGPIGLGLNGKMHVESQDDAAKVVNMIGEGADRKVPGNVRVKIKMAVSGSGESSELAVDSDAAIMGKLGEFGQGIIKKKADGIMNDFGKNLKKLVEG